MQALVSDTLLLQKATLLWPRCPTSIDTNLYTVEFTGPMYWSWLLGKDIVGLLLLYLASYGACGSCSSIFRLVFLISCWFAYLFWQIFRQFRGTLVTVTAPGRWFLQCFHSRTRFCCGQGAFSLFCASKFLSQAPFGWGLSISKLWDLG